MLHISKKENEKYVNHKHFMVQFSFFFFTVCINLRLGLWGEGKDIPADTLMYESFTALLDLEILV